jgi:hypothetical protein
MTPGESSPEIPFTLAGCAEAEERARAALAALVSAAKDAVGELFAGAALGGRLGSGEGAVIRAADGSLVPSDPFELLVVVDAPLRTATALGRRVKRAVGEAARARRVAAVVDVAARAALSFLPPTLRTLELAGAGRVAAGRPSLLSGAPDPGRTSPDPREGLRLLVRRGSDLLRAEAIADRTPRGRAAREALRIVGETDLALGAVVLLSAGRWVPGLRRRNAALRDLASGGAAGRAAAGFHARMTWTRFHDLVERHQAAVEARAEGPDGFTRGDARRQVGRAADRWLEVLRLSEEERLGQTLPDWTEHAAVLAGRSAAAADGVLFEDAFGEGSARRATRRAARAWEPAERLAPAIAALVDWDPGDLPIVPVLLDLPDGTPREALRQRAIAWGAAV